MSKSSLKNNERETCIVVAGNVDSGKCFSKNTKILMYNGSMKYVQEIKIGDCLMGDNGTIRNVLEIHNGIGQLYNILSDNGKILYKVNGKHILCLRNEETKEILEISVENYLKNELKYKNYVTYKQSIEYEKKKLLVNPYTCGLFIGKKLSNENLVDSDHLCSSNPSRQSLLENDFMANLNNEQIDFLNKNHGLDIYKQSSIKQRLKLLDGIGYFCYTSQILFDNTNQDTYNMILKKNIELITFICEIIDSIRVCYNILFKEDLCFLSLNKNQPTIKIQKNIIDEYYGFEVDNNKRFLLSNHFVCHNSTFMGVMSSGILDDGNGKARKVIAKHPHELDSGRTSDISTKTILLNNKHINMVDLCGHEKYLKTTMCGILGSYPDYGILMIAANRGIMNMTKEHLRILMYMGIPFTIIISRVDLVIDKNDMYKRLINQLKKILTRYKSLIFINSLSDYKNNNFDAKQSLIEAEKYADMIKDNPNLVPVITISNKTGYYIDVARHFISKLKPLTNWDSWDNDDCKGSIFYIDSVFNPPGVGLVVTGLVRGKTINSGDQLLLGPYMKKFIPIKIRSMHDNNKKEIKQLSNRQRGCLAIRIIDNKISFNKKNIKKGMLIRSNTTANNLCYQFTANIEVFKQSCTTITLKYTPVIHCGNIRQTAKIIIDNENLRIGDKALVKFRFIRSPEFIEIGSKFFFREGHTKGVGVVTSILPIDEDNDKNPASCKTRKKYNK